MALRVAVSFDDPGSAFAPYYAPLTSNLEAAAGRWGQHLNGDATLEVRVSFQDAARSGTASGGSFTSYFIGELNGTRVFQQGSAHEIVTGRDLTGQGFDAIIDIAPSYLTNELWFDPTPADRTAAGPMDKTDAVSVLLHELGHALGFNGWREGLSNELRGDFGSPYDTLVTSIDGVPYFTGPNAVAVYGGLVPLTIGNVTHYGNDAPHPGGELATATLMNGVAYRRGFMYDVTPLDLAFLADVGLPVNGFPPLPPGHELLTGGAGNDWLKGLEGRDALQGGFGNDTLEGGFDNDTLFGGGGVDTAVFSGVRADYAIVRTPSGYAVTHRTGVETDTLSAVERLRFADQRVAVDLEPGAAASNTAKILAAAFGREYVGNEEFAGIGLSLFDAGMSYGEVAALAVRSPFFGTLNNGDFVRKVYTNVVGAPPSAEDLSYYRSLLDTGQHTQGSLLLLAAETVLNQQNIDLVGLQQTGLEYV